MEEDTSEEREEELVLGLVEEKEEDEREEVEKEESGMEDEIVFPLQAERSIDSKDKAIVFLVLFMTMPRSRHHSII